jgi:hypothetical protein
MANTESFFSVVDSDEAAAVVASEAFKQSEFKDIKHRPGDVFYRLRTEVLDDQYTQQEKLRESLREWVSERDQNEVFFFKDARKKLGAPVRLRGHFYDLANKGVLVKLERGYKRAPLPGESTEEVVIDPAPKSGVGRKRKHVPAPIGESATGEAVSMGPAALKALRSHINRALRNLAFDKAHGGLDNSREDIEDLLARVRLPGAAVPADLRDRVTQGLEALGWTDFAQPVTASAGGGAAPALEARESALSGPLAKRRKANTRAATQDT